MDTLSPPPAAPVDREGQDRLPGEIPEDLLRKYFTLTDTDLAEIERCRGLVNKLGFAVQLCTLRWQGHFLSDTRDLPPAVLDVLAQQLGALPLPIPDYPQNEKTRWEHLERIREHLGFVKCDEAARQHLLRYIQECAATVPRITGLLTLACQWLYTAQIVRPGRTTLRELIGSVREAALQEVYATIYGGLTTDQHRQLDELLKPAPIDPLSAREDARPSASARSGTVRSRLEQFKLRPPRESPGALVGLTERLAQIEALGLATLPVLQEVHPATRGLLASWGYRYDVWSLRRFATAKRYSLILAFLHAALADTLDAIIEMQDKLITRAHNLARVRREAVLRTTDQARRRAVEVLAELGTLVVDETIPDAALRQQIFTLWPSATLATLVEECRTVRAGDDGTHLPFLLAWYGTTRKYSPALLASVPFTFSRGTGLEHAVTYMREVNGDPGRRFGTDAPTAFLSRRWETYVLPPEGNGTKTITRPYYELALLSTLNERLKSGDVTVPNSRRWTTFEEYLIPTDQWQRDQRQYYAMLGLPLEADAYIARLGEQLATVTAQVEARVPTNSALTIDAHRSTFSLAALEGGGTPDSVKQLKRLLEARLPRTDLVDLLIDIDNETDFLRHFISQGTYDVPASPAVHRRNVLAALIAVGCNIGPHRMAVASPGIRVHAISRIADWYFSEDALKAASIDLVNYATSLPLSRVWGSGNTCSADGMRFYVPINIMADYSPLLADRGVTLLTHTADNYVQFYQQAVPCRLREATFVLDGLKEHDTELDPKTCYTDTHGYTEVVMATAALLGFELAPRIRDIKDQTLYKLDRRQKYPHLDPLLTGTIRPYLIRYAWDEVVRVLASIHTRVVSPSLILHRLGSYARRNSIYQALAEIGRVHKTILILRYVDDEQLRRRARRELNKGESSHDLSRFLCFGKEGRLRGHELEDQLHTFSCLAVLHNAVVAWNTSHLAQLVERLRAEGHGVDERDLAQLSPLMRKHLNPFGRYHFNLDRMKRVQTTQ